MRQFLLMERIIRIAKLLIFTLILESVLISCKRIHVNANKNIIFKVDVENCKTLIDLKLSDLIDSCWLVPLETTNESALGNSFRYIYITNDHIIVDDNNGIYLFAEDGKFINKILNIGRGPDEVSISHTIYYYEKKDLLFINDHFNNLNNILCYHVKSQTFQPPIKKCFANQWDDFTILNDSLILGSLYDMDAGSNPYAIFFQDFKGNFISGIKSKRKITSRNQTEVLQRMFFYLGDQKIHVKYTYDDTLFVLDGNKLLPFLIVQYNSPQIDPPHMGLNIGEKRSYFERFENSSFIIFRNQTFKGMIPFKSGALKADYKIIYFLLNKSKGNYGIIKSYADDFIGKIQTSDSETMTLPKSLPNNKLYVLYNANELLQKTSTELVGRGFSKSLYNQLSKIKSNLRETDNPILLIGKPKN